MMKFKCPSCGFRSESESPAFDVYYERGEGYCPEEKKWVKMGYDTTDAQGNIIPYTTDEITVLCVNNEGMEDFLDDGMIYKARFEKPLPFKNGHWIEVYTDEHTVDCLPERFVIVNP